MTESSKSSESDDGIEIRVNGETKRFRAALLVSELLAELGLPEVGVAVERNRVIVPRAEHATTSLQGGDEVEIVTLVGGG